VFELRPEFAGRLLQCPTCGRRLRAGRLPSVTREAQPGLDPAFDRDIFLLNQRVLTIASRYEVWAPDGTPVVYVERPTYFVRTLLAYGLGFAAAAATLGALAEVPLLSVVLAAAVFLVVSMSARPLRHVTVYRDDSRAATLLRIMQNERIAVLTRSYTVVSPDGTALARLRKHYLHNLFRKRWYAESPGGEVLAVAMEDSIILSLLRRVLGTLFGVLRTNFVIHRGHGGDVLGEFNRKFTLRDRYVLDMTGDPDRTLDRRIAFSLGVMLDSGERR
jgi:uncharacterized protein YxjI